MQCSVELIMRHQLAFSEHHIEEIDYEVEARDEVRRISLPFKEYPLYAGISCRTDG